MSEVERIREANAAASVTCIRCGVERQSHVAVTTIYGSTIWICQQALYVAATPESK